MRLVKIPNRVYPPGIDLSVRSQILHEVEVSVSASTFDELLGAVFNDLYDALPMRLVKLKLERFRESAMGRIGIEVEWVIDQSIEVRARETVEEGICAIFQNDLWSQNAP